MNDSFFDSRFLEKNGINLIKVRGIRETHQYIYVFEFDHLLNTLDLQTFAKQFKAAQSGSKFDVSMQITYKNLNLDNEKLYLGYLSFLLRNSLDYKLMNLPCANTKFENGTFKMIVPESKTITPDISKKIEDLFKEYGLTVKMIIGHANQEEVEEYLDEKIQTEQEAFHKAIEAQAEIAEKNQMIKETQKKEKTRKKVYASNCVPINTIPSTPSGIDEYLNTNGPANFTIQGEVFSTTNRLLGKSGKYLYEIAIYDGTDSITLKKFVDDSERKTYDAIKVGDVIRVSGPAAYDLYAKEVTLTIKNLNLVGKKEVVEPEDSAKEKRVELHLHTNMSALDATTDVAAYVKRAKLWNNKAIAFTDHDGIYSFHDVMEETGKAGIKPIYGVELGFVDESKFNISYTEEDIDLMEATYVVFDLETTGFSVIHDEIIQIAACKVHSGNIVDSFNVFVNPHRKLPGKIVELTSITDEQVSAAEDVSVVLPKFLEFIGDSILVAQNASFDVSHIYENMKKLGIPITKKFPVIDTMQLARNFFSDEMKTFNLKSLAKQFKVSQEHHHLADDDARVTAEVFIKMLPTLYKAGALNYKDINKTINQAEAYKHVIPYHINLLVKNQVGYKNLFKIVSDSLTDHYYKESRLLKSVLDKYREGILVGSGCQNGEIFELALNKSDDELEEAMAYYDYIEVQPYDIYAKAMKRDNYNDINYVDLSKKTIERIIAMAKKLGKMVVATSDCHYLDKSDKEYRDIYISAPQLGGGTHHLASCVETPDQHFRSTTEMLNNFGFLGDDLANEIVVTNTNLIADMIETIVPFRTGKEDLYSPADDELKDSLGIPSIKEDLLRIVYENAHKNYGDPLPQYVQDRLDKELKSIINNGYSPIYYMSYLLVKKSNDDGYVVGSRGSVGSSFVATMMKITEVNALAPHYFCKKCHFTAFKFTEEQKSKYPMSEEEMKLDPILQSVESGYDLPKCNCPKCGNPLSREGQDIPFETFLGFAGDKTPDIDLNFSGVYQPNAHEYIRSIMGPDNAFRAGTVTTVAENTAIGYVRGHLERKGLNLRSTEIKRIAKHLEGVRRSTGQHPGGVVVVPSYKDIYDVTPIQYPADKTDNNWRTTHFDYHQFEANLLKFDILGHDDPTTLRYLFDYVEAHPEEFPFATPQDIPLDDPDVLKMFNETEVLGLKPDDINCTVATFALPEFGTKLTRNMLIETKPQTFADLVKISGLSHGTGIWQTNGLDLVQGKTDFGEIPFSEVIGCRDDIMVKLLQCGMEPKKAFDIMEFVRKGKAAKKENPPKWEAFEKDMKANPNVPNWYAWSCSKIEYMFPKAHAVAYVLMAVRIAWFKLHKPLVFYSAFFTIRAGQFEPDNMLAGVTKIRSRIVELSALTSRTAKEDDLLTMYQVAVEMIKRGFVFLPVDIRYSHATHFLIEEKGLRLPFVAVEKLGESVANDIMEKRNEHPFTSKEDVLNRTKINKSVFETMSLMGAFADLPEKDSEIKEEKKNDSFDQGLFGLFD